MGLISWLFGSKAEHPPAPEHRDRRQEDAARKLSPAMPMAAAGAELAGQRDRSETEEAIERAVGEDRSKR